MKRYILPLLCVALVLMYGCSKDEVSAEQVKVVWEKEYTDLLAVSIQPMIIGDKVIVSRTVYQSATHPHLPFFAYDKNTGKLLWEWSDYSSDIFWFASEKVYVYEKYLVFAGYNSVYCIDTETGKTAWEYRDPVNFVIKGVSGMGSKVYYVHGTQEQEENWISEHDILTNERRELVRFKQQGGYKPQVRIPTAFVDEAGNRKLAVSYTMYDVAKNDAKFHWGVYDYNSNALTFNQELKDSLVGNIGQIVVKNGKAYIGVGDRLFCHDLETKARLWDNVIVGRIGFTRYIVEGDYVYCGSEGLNPQLYCFEDKTGKLLWQVHSSGTSSPMSYYKDKIYFRGGGDGKLHVVDALSGVYVGKYDAPKFRDNSNLSFSCLSLDPNTGRMYTTDYQSVYCLEAME